MPLDPLIVALLSNLLRLLLDDSVFDIVLSELDLLLQERTPSLLEELVLRVDQLVFETLHSALELMKLVLLLEESSLPLVVAHLVGELVFFGVERGQALSGFIAFIQLRIEACLPDD